MQLIIALFRFLLSTLVLSPGQAPVRQLSAKIRRIKQRRLEELEAQAAAYGPATPPEITNEIEDLRNELAIVDNLERAKLDPPMQELLGRYDTSDQIIAFFRTQASRVRHLEESIGELAERFDQWTQKREAQDEQRSTREQRERSIGGLLTGIILTVLVVVLILLIVLLNKGLT
jgi:cell division protein FtsB